MIYDEDFTYFNISMVWIFEDNLVCKTIRIYIPCKNLSYLGKKYFSIYMVQNGIDLNNDSIVKDPLTSRYPKSALYHTYKIALSKNRWVVVQQIDIINFYVNDVNA